MQKHIVIVTLAAMTWSSPLQAEIEILCDFSSATQSKDTIESPFLRPVIAIASNQKPVVVERKRHERVLEIPGDDGVRHFLVVRGSRETFVNVVTILPDGRSVRTSHWGDPASPDTELRSDSDMGTCEVRE